MSHVPLLLGPPVLYMLLRPSPGQAQPQLHEEWQQVDNEEGKEKDKLQDEAARRRLRQARTRLREACSLAHAAGRWSRSAAP